MLAGDAGAIIGSRKEIEPIKTTYETNDNRRTYIYFNDGRNITISGYSMYEWLMGIVPEKEYNSYIQRVSQQQTNH